MNWLLDTAFDRLVTEGTLTVVDGKGARRSYGDDRTPKVVIRLADRRTERDLVIDPELHLGEAYADGRLTIETGTPYDLIALLLRNQSKRGLPRWNRIADFIRRRVRLLEQLNSRSSARRNASFHYDVDPRIYELFLDSDLQYSCAYFEDMGTAKGDRLDAAQRAKKRHIADKLLIRPGQTILDIGCGWGGLALELADVHGANVRGITLSQQQCAIARSRARRRGLQDRVTFAIEDYRDTAGLYDRIVSVGMLEHVGQGNYRRYFKAVSDRLRDDGIALIHTIGRSDDAHGTTNPFIKRYIFPGGYAPALSELMAAVEKCGLVLGDIEVLRLHYARTLEAWRRRFDRNRSQAVEIAGERFCRIWEFYLAGAEAAFRYQNLVVFQLQLAKRIDAIPATRDYLYARQAESLHEQIAAAPERGARANAFRGDAGAPRL